MLSRKFIRPLLGQTFYITVFVLQQDSFIALWQLWKEGKDDRSLSCTQKARKNGDWDGRLFCRH